MNTSRIDTPGLISKRRMDKLKENYETPEMEIVEFSSEEILCYEPGNSGPDFEEPIIMNTTHF